MEKLNELAGRIVAEVFLIKEVYSAKIIKNKDYNDLIIIKVDFQIDEFTYSIGYTISKIDLALKFDFVPFIKEKFEDVINKQKIDPPLAIGDKIRNIHTRAITRIVGIKERKLHGKSVQTYDTSDGQWWREEELRKHNLRL